MFFGSAYWRFVHYFALHNTGRELFTDIPKFLPPTYAAEWEAPKDDEDLIDWSLRIHNRMNSKKGDWDKWDRTDFHIAHKPECDFCANKEYVFFFPWGFIHSIADTRHEDALPFLKLFGALYPEKSMTFFTDDLNEGESLLDWTIRHHKRMNVEAGRDEFMYVPIQPTGTTGTIAAMSEGCTDCP